MTKAETIELITRIVSYYPSWQPKISQRELLDNWYEALKKYEFEPVKDMLDKYIADDESGYAPAISNLIPKQKSNGFKGRIYSHADFLEMERAALEEWS